MSQDILKAPKGYHQVFAQVLRRILKLNGVGLIFSKSQTVWAAHSKDRSWKISLRLGEERREVAFRKPENPCRLGGSGESSVFISPLSFSGGVPTVGATVVLEGLMPQLQKTKVKAQAAVLTAALRMQYGNGIWMYQFPSFIALQLIYIVFRGLFL